MASLKTIVSALQQEIAVALEENKSLPACAQLQAGKVIVSLEVAFQESKTGAIEIGCPRHARTGNGASEASGHRVTIEFNVPSIVTSAGNSASRPQTQASPSTRIDPSEAAQVMQSL